MADTGDAPSLLVLLGSPRRRGNSALLAEAAAERAEVSGARVKVRFLADYIDGFLRDCRDCRQADGSCRIDDGYRDLFLDDFLPADGVIFASPVYWYGVSAQLKAFLDRSFCYYAASYPESADVVKAMIGKQLGLVLRQEAITCYR